MDSQKSTVVNEHHVMQIINSMYEMRDNLMELSFAMSEFQLAMDSLIDGRAKSKTDEVLRRIKEKR